MDDLRAMSPIYVCIAIGIAIGVARGIPIGIAIGIAMGIAIGIAVGMRLPVTVKPTRVQSSQLLKEITISYRI